MTAADLPPGFLAFWKRYPARRRGKRPKAIAAWTKALREGATAEAIMAGLEAWWASDDWRHDEGEWSPEPHRWLEQEQWKTPPAPRRGGRRRGAGPSTTMAAIAAFLDDDEATL